MIERPEKNHPAKVSIENQLKHMNNVSKTLQ